MKRARAVEPADARKARLERDAKRKRLSRCRASGREVNGVVPNNQVLSVMESRAQLQRAARVDETRCRNVGNQMLGIMGNTKARTKRRVGRYAAMQRDRDSFHAELDDPLLYICGACGELVHGRKKHVFQYSDDDSFFDALKVNGDGEPSSGLVSEAIVKVGGVDTVPFCERCVKSMRRRRAPKFSTASRFEIAQVPVELRALNPMEERMIGIGVCFTTCYRLVGGQEGTKGNGISFWNDVCNLATILPRPLSKCGVVRLKSSRHVDGSHFFNVRPHYIRAALYWLIENNPLYKNVKIDEDLLTGLERSHGMSDLPVLDVDANDVDIPERSNTSEYLYVWVSVSTML